MAGEGLSGNPSRRRLLLGGAVSAAAALAAATAGTALALDRTRATPDRQAAPAPTPTATSAPTPTPTPTSPADVLGTVLLSDRGAPDAFGSLQALPDRAVMQDLVLEPGTGMFFVTQKTAGSNGTTAPYESTIVNRVRVTDGVTVDSMTLVDGGHGLGFEVETDADGAWLWITWHGASADSGMREQDFVRLRYVPGVWTRGAAVQQLGLSLVPFQDRTPEAVYHFDWAKDSAVERHWNPPGVLGAPTETFVRRRISDLRAGVDQRLAEIRLRASPPTTQGFATVNGTLFRWLGSTALAGTPSPADPIALEQYSWATGQLVGAALLPDVGKPWADGTCEPQGMSVYREADGTASLVLGITTGVSGNHGYEVVRFASIGAA